MTERLKDLFIEFDEMGFSPTIPCGDLEKAAVEWRDKVVKEIAALESENAALRDRLEKAVELPRIIHPNETEWHIQYQNEYGIIFSEIRFSKEAAEARLAELKGESKKTIIEEEEK